MTQKHLGFCPCCRGDFRLTPKNLLVHHGYKRPGDGYIHGDCFGVDKVPHELSDVTAKMWLEYLVEVIRIREKALEELPSRIEFFERGHNNKLVELRKSELSADRWAYILRTKTSALQLEISSLSYIRDETQILIDTWTLKPLRLVDDLEVVLKAERDARKAAKDEAKRVKTEADAAKRAARMVSRIKNLTKDVDRWVKKDEPNKLGDLYYKIVKYLPDVCERKFKPEEILPWFDRDDVWRQLGLLNDGGYVLPARDPEWDPKTRSWKRRPGDEEQDRRFYDLTLRRGRTT